MDPALATALATIASAISTAILMFAAYNWPTDHHRDRDDDDDDHTRRGSRR